MTPERRRLRVLRSTQLLDTPPERAFDRLTRIAARMLGAPAALVSLVDEHRQFFKSSYGLGEPWVSRRETPLSHSFCQYAARDRAPLIVSDARDHPLLRDNRAISELSVVAYAGIPLFVEHEAIGVFCVVDVKPRDWSAEEIALLSDLAESVVSEIELRTAVREIEQRRALTDALLDSMGDGVLAIDTSRTCLIANAAARRVFAEGAEVGKTLPGDWATIHRSMLPDGSALQAEQGALARALRGEPTDGLELTLQRPSAENAVWVEISGRPVRNPAGEIVAAIAVYRDVTESRRRSDLFAALARNIPDGAVVIFDADLRCVAIDGGLVHAEGIDPVKAIGRTMREIVGAATASSREFDAVEQAYRQTLAGASLELDFRANHRTLALSTSPVRDAHGRITAGIVLALNVTEQRALEEERRRNEQIYRAIVQHLPAGAVFTLDRDFRYLSADGGGLQTMLEISGLDVASLVGKKLEDIVSGDNRAAVTALVQAAFDGQSQRLEVTRWDRAYELIAEPITDANGVPTTALLFWFDITARKLAHDTLVRERAFLDQFRAFVENISMGITVMQDGVIVFVNRAMCEILGYDDASALLGQLALDRMVHPDDRDEAGPRLATAATTEIASRRTRCLRRDGTTVQVETTARPFVFDGLPSVIAATRDTTDEVNAERVRREYLTTVETFRLMVEAVSDYAIFQLDSDGHVRTWNAGARAIKGYEAGEIIGQHIRTFYPTTDRTRAELGLASAREHGRHRDEGWRIRKDGSRFWASIVITALRPDGGEVTGFVKVTRDLTERKQVEDARARSLAEKTAMLQEIHHRVKNNLQMVSSLLNLQARQIRDPAARSIFVEMQHRVHSIALLHENLYQSDDLGRVDMHAYVARLISTLRRAYSETGAPVRFVVEVDRLELPLDLAVPCGLIINELVTNVLKHAFKDTAKTNEVRISLQRIEDRIALVVADNGGGFATPIELDDTETMGLGLVRDLGSQLRATVTFSSAGGACCTVRFPVPELVQAAS